MKTTFKELIHWVLILAPFVYLYSIWETLPASVPMHFNIDGKADNWVDKSTLPYFPTTLPLLLYLLFMILPKIDPKKKLIQMGDKYNHIRLIMTVFFTGITIFNLYICKEGYLRSPNILTGMLGILFAALGNYFQAVRPNYFVGVRVPWTLESEQVWISTHRMAGRLWIAGGALALLVSFIIHDNLLLMISFLSIVAIISIVPLIYSYIIYNKEKQTT